MLAAMAHSGDLKDVALGGGTLGGTFFAMWKLLAWLTGRHDRRQALLDAQDERQDREWQKLRENLEGVVQRHEARIAALESKNEALRLVIHHLAGALVRVDPDNPALALADQILAVAFPVDLAMLSQRAEIALEREATRAAGKGDQQ